MQGMTWGPGQQHWSVLEMQNPTFNWTPDSECDPMVFMCMVKSGAMWRLPDDWPGGLVALDCLPGMLVTLSPKAKGGCPLEPSPSSCHLSGTKP